MCEERAMQFDYFYGNEAEQFTFYRIPKILFTSPRFRRLSDSAKLLYGLMLDRMQSKREREKGFEARNRGQTDEVVQIPITELKPFEEQPFKVLMDESISGQVTYN